jgi:hypothetical protein
MLRKFTATSASMIISMIVMAQDSSKTTSAFKLSGSADINYRYNLDKPKSYPYNSPTSFTHSQNSFELGMASVKAEHTIGKVGMVADLGFGTRAEEFAYNDANTRFAIKQLYITYAPSSAIKFTLGSWATHIGYEVLDAYLNRNYSMSYMFSYGPFSHTGLKAEFTLSAKSTLMVGVANPTDFRTAPGMPKTVIAQLATSSKDDKLKAYFNFQGGKQNDAKKLMQGDVVLTYSVNDKFSLGYNGTVQSVKLSDSLKHWNNATWWGSALYVNLDPVSWFGLTLRGEYLGDKDDFLGLNNAFEGTLSANFRIDNLTIIPEIRFDDAKNEIFYKSPSEVGKSTGTFILAATYHF